MRLQTLMAVAVVAFLCAAPAAATTWRCDVDLHQGDTGRLEFNLTGSDLSGSIAVNRNGTVMTSQVSGTWSGEAIAFTRTLSPATTIQPFRGVALDGGDGRTKMAGRFAAGFEGIWSAVCTSGPQDGGGRPDPPRGPGAERPPVSPGRGGTCSISGAVTGPRASLASTFSVILYGPDSMTTVRGRQPLGSGRYQFSDLPDGRYVVAADTKADVSVTISPRRQVVTCQGGAVTANFEFR